MANQRRCDVVIHFANDQCTHFSINGFLVPGILQASLEMDPCGSLLLLTLQPGTLEIEGALPIVTHVPTQAELDEMDAEAEEGMTVVGEDWN